MTKDQLRAEVPDLALLADTLRAIGFDVTLKHVEFEDGREIGKRPTDPPNWATQDWTNAPSLYEVACAAGSKRR